MLDSTYSRLDRHSPTVELEAGRAGDVWE
ncbi:hypothetical protein AVEN_188345-1, partial [Araneus ventricosus]